MSSRRVIVPPPSRPGPLEAKTSAAANRTNGREATFESLDDEPGSLAAITSELPPPPARVSIIPAVRRSVASILPAARASIQSVLPWKPRWRPWSPARAVSVTLSFAAAFSLLVYMAYPRFVQYAARIDIRRVLPAKVAAPAEPVVAAAATVEPAPQGEAADAHLNRFGRSPLSGGLLIIPPSFHSQDGAYDLVIHFNGNTDLVEESFGAAKVNSLVVIFNLGVGSGVYEDRFANPSVVPEILDRVKTTMEKRGLVAPHVRRIALGAWSAGYGGAEKSLGIPEVYAKVDAIYLLDALHCGYAPGDGKKLEMPKLRPFVDFAREALTGKKLFFATHSEIDPVAYAGTGETIDAILGEIGIKRKPLTEMPVMPVLQSLIGVLPHDKIKPLTPKTQVNEGGLIIRGYTGEGPEDHMSHLMQMAETALPILVKRWSETGGASRK